MTSELFGTIFFVSRVRFPRLKRTFRNLLSEIEEQESLLEAGLPFTFAHEIEITNSLLNYSNESVSYLEVLRSAIAKDLGQSFKFSLPFEHRLLREFRNINHHSRYFPIQPFRTERDRNGKFVIWPIFSMLRAIKKDYPEWCEKRNNVQLSTLIIRHQEFLDKYNEKLIYLLKKREESGKAKVVHGPPNALAEIAGGTIISDEESWVLTVKS